MKLTTMQVINAYNWAMSVRTKPLTTKVAYLLATNVQNMSNVVTSYEQQRRELLEKYTTINEDGEQVQNNVDEMNAEFKELLDCEVEVVINKINLSDMKDINITMERMLLISFLFEM